MSDLESIMLRLVSCLLWEHRSGRQPTVLLELYPRDVSKGIYRLRAGQMSAV